MSGVANRSVIRGFNFHQEGSAVRGTIRWFNNSKGYGFIGCEAGGDIFVHYSGIVGDGYRTLQEGDRVEFEIVQGLKGPQATKRPTLGQRFSSFDKFLKAGPNRLKVFCEVMSGWNSKSVRSFQFTNHNIEQPADSVILGHFRDVVFVEGDSPVRTGLTIIAYISAKAGHQDQVRDALLDLLAHTRKEKGCVNYDLHQSQENGSEFAIYENWESATDLDAHARSVHLQAFTRIAGHLLERPAEIRKWNMVSELSGTNR